MDFEQTLRRSFQLNGIGLHSGRDIKVRVRPGKSGDGIVFHCHTKSGVISFEAHRENVLDTRLATVLGCGDVKVSTVEHLLAALSAAGVDHAHIDVNGPEIPIMDGSAKEFMRLIRRAGLKPLSTPRKYIVFNRAISVSDGDRRISIIPDSSFSVTFTISFDHSVIKTQSFSHSVSRSLFEADIAEARTFGFEAEVNALRAAGLALGGGLHNAVVVGEAGVLNPEGLRFHDEFVRHKILDVVGDLSLVGHRMLGHVVATKSGHDLNAKLVEKILKNKDAWRLMTASAELQRERGPQGHPSLVSCPVI